MCVKRRGRERGRDPKLLIGKKIFTVSLTTVPTLYPSSSAPVAPASLAPDQQLFITDREPTSTDFVESGMAAQAWRMACREPWLLNLVRRRLRLKCQW